MSILWMISTAHHYLKTVSSGQLLGAGGVECNAHFWGNGWGVGPPIARVQLGSTDAPILWITSPNNNCYAKRGEKTQIILHTQ